MLKYALAGALTIGTIAPVMAAEPSMFYVVRKGSEDCKVSEKQPTEWEQVSVLGEYKTKAEAQKKITEVCGKEPPKKN